MILPRLVFSVPFAYHRDFILQYLHQFVVFPEQLLPGSAVLVFLNFSIWNRNAQVNRDYPLAASTEPPAIRLIPYREADFASAPGKAEVHKNDTYSNFDRKKWARVDVVLRASGIIQGDRWQLAAFRPTLTPANGAALALDWQSGGVTFDSPDDPQHLEYQSLAFLVNRADYERFRQAPLTLRIDLAFTQATPAWSRQFPLPDGILVVPGFGFCLPAKYLEHQTLSIFGLVCRFGNNIFG